MYFPIIDVLKENFIEKIPSIVTKWLTDNVDPVGSAVVVDESLSISGAAADAKVTGDEIGDLKSELNNVIEDSYDTTTKVVHSSPTGWRLNESDGLCSEDPAYKLIKYAVTEGDLLKIVSDDRFQFQSTVSVPSTGTPTRIGKTYGDGIAYVTVPIGATFLILSTPVENSIAVAYGLTDKLSELQNEDTKLKSEFDNFLDIVVTRGEKVDTGWKFKANGTVTPSSGFDIYAVDLGRGGGEIFALVKYAENALSYAQFQNTKYTSASDTTRIIGDPFNNPLSEKLEVPTVSTGTVYFMFNVKNTDTESGILTSNTVDTLLKDADFYNDMCVNASRWLGNRITFLHFSDIHADTAALEKVNEYVSKYADSIDDVICTGDMVGNTGEAIASWWNPNYLTCIGNHDSATYNSGYNWTGVSMAERCAYYIDPFKSNWGVQHETGKSYYYKDYSYFRLIVLDVMVYNNPESQDATDETEWLSDVLDDANTLGYHVMIATHAPHGGAKPISCNFTKYGQETMPVYTDCNTPDIVTNLVSSKISSGLVFAGYLCGHTHQDNIFDALDNGKQLMYVLACTATTQQAQWESTDLYRDINCVPCNLVTIDTSRRIVKIVRFGADRDNYLRPRKTICFNYNTGSVINSGD